MVTLDEMAAKGYEKLSRKAATISSNWEAAKDIMIAEYNALPFGPRTKAAFADGIRAAKHRTDPDKWRRKWVAGVSR